MKRTKTVNVLTVIGGVAFAAAFLIGLIAFAGFFTIGSSYKVSAYVYNARGIAKYSTVFEAGLPVGIVTGIKRSGPDAVVSMRIDKGVRPLPVDSKVQLGLRSLIGESDVLLYPGSSKEMVRNNGSLGLSQNQSYTEVDQILNTFAPPNESGVRNFIQGLGDSVRGQGQNLNDTVGGFAALVNNSQPLTSILAHQRTQVADIIQYFGDVMGAIGQRMTALQSFARGALITFNTVAKRDTQLKAMLSNFPYVLSAATAAGHALRDNQPYLGYTLNHLATVVHDLSPSVPLIAPGAENGGKIINALGSAAPELKGLLGNLRQLQPSATQALPAIHALTCQANPMIRYLKPYGPDISAFFQDFGAADNFYSSAGGGHELPGVLVVDPKAVVRGVTTQPVNNGLTTLLNLGVFRASGAQPFYYHATRPPGQRNSLTYGAGDYTPAQFGATHPYTRVTADCAS
jgi:phospholipid/cholesterol/gamma-HCH transport system substrate-binding protein